MTHLTYESTLKSFWVYVSKYCGSLLLKINQIIIRKCKQASLHGDRGSSDAMELGPDSSSSTHQRALVSCKLNLKLKLLVIIMCMCTAAFNGTDFSDFANGGIESEFYPTLGR